MAHRLRFGEARKTDGRRALKRAEPRRDGRRIVDIDAGRVKPADLEDQRLF
jgi:hypothetical protein